MENNLVPFHAFWLTDRDGWILVDPDSILPRKSEIGARLFMEIDVAENNLIDNATLGNRQCQPIK